MKDAERTIKLEVAEIARPTARRPVLVVIQGQGLGSTAELRGETTVIGRGSAADFTLRDDVASRQHAQIKAMQSKDGCVEYYLIDLGSTNGTYLNGSRVIGEQLLQDGDKIKIGEHLLKFAQLDEFEAEFQERLHQMIQRDELTGLRSRRSLFAELDREMDRAARTPDPQPISVLMMDLDYFKKVNDAHGHLIGSQTIRETGHIIADVVGSVDRAGRYGGEEFLAYVVGPAARGLDLAEAIRTRVAQHPFASSATETGATETGGSMHVTISIGLASFPVDGKKALEVTQRADQALYRAKLSGRNQTCRYDADLDQHRPSSLQTDASAIVYGPADSQ